MKFEFFVKMSIHICSLVFDKSIIFHNFMMKFMNHRDFQNPRLPDIQTPAVMASATESDNVFLCDGADDAVGDGVGDRVGQCAGMPRS